MYKINSTDPITEGMLDDLGFLRIKDDFHGLIDYDFEEGYLHSMTEPTDFILVWVKDWGYAFRQRQKAIGIIGRMKTLQDLIEGFKFISCGTNLFDWSDLASKPELTVGKPITSPDLFMLDINTNRYIKKYRSTLGLETPTNRLDTGDLKMILLALNDMGFEVVKQVPAPSEPKANNTKY